MTYHDEPSCSTCAVCSKEASMQCIQCLRNSERQCGFCGPDCFKAHWSQHRNLGTTKKTTTTPSPYTTPNRPRLPGPVQNISPLPSPYNYNDKIYNQHSAMAVAHQLSRCNFDANHGFHRTSPYRAVGPQRQVEVTQK